MPPPYDPDIIRQRKEFMKRYGNQKPPVPLPPYRTPGSPAPPAPGGPLGQIPYPFPYIERPLPLGHGQVPTQMQPGQMRRHPPYPLERYPSGGAMRGVSPGPWMKQFQQDLIDQDKTFSDSYKAKLYELYKKRGLQLPSKARLVADKFRRGTPAADQAKEMIMARERSRAAGNLIGAGQMGANMGVDYLNDYLNRVYNPTPQGSPGGTAVLPIPGAMDPASILNLGAQHLLGGDIGIAPGVTLPGRR